MGRLLAILRFAHDRPMLQIGPNPRSCGGKSWSRTHAAVNREFDDLACHRAALWLPTGGWRAALFPRYLRIMARRMAALWLHYGAGRRPFFRGNAPIMPTTMAALQLPTGDWRAAFCPDMRRLWRQGEHIAPHRGGLVPANFIDYGGCQ